MARIVVLIDPELPSHQIRLRPTRNRDRRQQSGGHEPLDRLGPHVANLLRRQKLMSSPYIEILGPSLDGCQRSGARQRNSSATPLTATRAPMKPPIPTFSFFRTMTSGMMRTGVRAMMLAATPATVSRTASSDRETPRTGPKKAPSA